MQISVVGGKPKYWHNINIFLSLSPPLLLCEGPLTRDVAWRRLVVSYWRFGNTYVSHVDRLTVEGGTGMWSQNNRNKLSTYAPQHLRRVKTWTALRRKPVFSSSKMLLSQPYFLRNLAEVLRPEIDLSQGTSVYTGRQNTENTDMY